MSDCGLKLIKTLVIGDNHVGKSSLIHSFSTGCFVDNLVHELSPTNIGEEVFPYSVPMLIKDSSSRWTNQILEHHMRECDVIVLCFSVDCEASFDNIESKWLKFCREREINIPIVLVSCKMELGTRRLDEVQSILHRYSQIDSYVDCSSLGGIRVSDVFVLAQKAAIYPSDLLFDRRENRLKPMCERALKRIFKNFDKDKDDALNAAELRNFQVECYGDELRDSSFHNLRKFVADRCPVGVCASGITFTGFTYMLTSYVKEGHADVLWSCLRTFGYDNSLQMREDLLSVSLARNSRLSVELAKETMTFLDGIFKDFAGEHAAALEPAKLEDLFSTAPESPWAGGPYLHAAEKRVIGELPLNGFRSLWALMALLDPAKTFANLKYIGYRGTSSSAFHVSSRSRLLQNWHCQHRNVFQCFVFGPQKAGKSALLNLLIRRPFDEEYAQTTQQYAANVVGNDGKTLVMRKVPPGVVSNELESPEFLARCDVAAFVYDSSDINSWEQMLEIFSSVCTHAEAKGFEVPCLFVAAKSDLEQQQFVKDDSARVCNDMNLQPPLTVSCRSGDDNEIFQNIIRAAQHPQQNIPNTHVRRKMKFAVYFISVGAAILGGLAARYVINKKRRERNNHH